MHKNINIIQDCLGKVGRKLFIISALLLVFVIFAVCVKYASAAENFFSQKTVIAFGSDADQNKPQPIWDTVLSFNPDIFLFLGDNVYADTKDENVKRAAYSKLLEKPGFQNLLARNIPIMATWDDHDYGVDDIGAEFSAKEISQKVFLDFFAEPQDSPRRNQKGIYNAQIFGEEGKRVQIIALDTRYFRSAHKKDSKKIGYVANDDADATILGEEQWKWLAEELQEPAEVRIIMSSIQVITKDNAWENWMNFPNERQRLFNLIEKTKADGIIFVSGDRHFSELDAMDAGIGYPIYNLTTGSLNKSSKEFTPEKNLFRLEKKTESDESFGLITIDWGFMTPPQIILESKNIDGKSTIQRKIPLAVLKRGILPVIVSSSRMRGSKSG